MTKQILSEQRPALVHAPSGKWYLVAPFQNWLEVGKKLTINEIDNKYWKRGSNNTTSKNKKPPVMKVYNVAGSKTNVYYTVTNHMNIWNCSCPAKQFKPYTDCKHIIKIKTAR